MFNNVKDRFRENPSVYYALSICATWAGIGSLMNGVALTQSLGYVPSAIWVAGNIFACILFGLVCDQRKSSGFQALVETISLT